MMEHELWSVEMKVVGFLAQKLPKATHLLWFTAFLKQQLPMMTPQSNIYMNEQFLKALSDCFDLYSRVHFTFHWNSVKHIHE
jgi:hypothetical protein